MKIQGLHTNEFTSFECYLPFLTIDPPHWILNEITHLHIAFYLLNIVINVGAAGVWSQTRSYCELQWAEHRSTVFCSLWSFYCKSVESHIYLLNPCCVSFIRCFTINPHILLFNTFSSRLSKATFYRMKTSSCARTQLQTSAVRWQNRKCCHNAATTRCVV